MRRYRNKVILVLLALLLAGCAEPISPTQKKQNLYFCGSEDITFSRERTGKSKTQMEVRKNKQGRYTKQYKNIYETGVKCDGEWVAKWGTQNE